MTKLNVVRIHVFVIKYSSYAELYSGTQCLNAVLSLHLRPYFLYVSSECSRDCVSEYLLLNNSSLYYKSA